MGSRMHPIQITDPFPDATGGVPAAPGCTLAAPARRSRPAWFAIPCEFEALPATRLSIGCPTRSRAERAR